MDDVEEGPQAVDLEEFPRQGTGEIEAEAVDMHVGHPVAQAVHNELEDAGMLHVQRVATPGEIHVIARVLRREPVVGLLSMPRMERVGPIWLPSAVWL